VHHRRMHRRGDGRIARVQRGWICRIACGYRMPRRNSATWSAAVPSRVSCYASGYSGERDARPESEQPPSLAAAVSHLSTATSALRVHINHCLKKSLSRDATNNNGGDGQHTLPDNVRAVFHATVADSARLKIFELHRARTWSGDRDHDRESSRADHRPRPRCPGGHSRSR